MKKNRPRIGAVLISVGIVLVSLDRRAGSGCVRRDQIQEREAQLDSLRQGHLP